MSARRSPWLAAVLNFTVMGAGTVYVGRRRGVGLALLLGLGLVRVGEVAIKLRDRAPGEWPMLLGGLLVLQVALAVDAYREAADVS